MTASAIEQSALRLPKPDRAHLVHLPFESLDARTEKDIQELWLHEARSRACEIDRCRVNLVTGKQLEQQIRAPLQ